MAKNNKKTIPEEEIESMRGFQRNLWASMLQTSFVAGIKIISDDTCCKLLAWVFVLGGGTEESTHNIKLNTALMHAQKRANLLGGERVNLEFLEPIKNYSQDLNNFIEKKAQRPEWLTKLETEYNIAPHKFRGEILPNEDKK